jgi:predicted amidophosphoribosyltransferase
MPPRRPTHRLQTMTINHSRRSRISHPTADAVVLPREYRLQFGACYVYSPKGESEVSERSRQLCARVKHGSTKWLRSYVARVHQEAIRKHRFCGFFNEHTLLVPIPNSPSSMRTSFWVARRLALTLQEAGLAEDVWTGLRRVSSVERSSSAWMWERPTVQQHYRSFAVIPSPRPPTEIVLVDDVVTKGRTLVAAAMRLHEAFPKADIRAFALVRTMGLILDVERLFDPCEGVIRWNGNDAYRDP